MSATKSRLLAVTAGVLLAAAQAGALGADTNEGTDVSNQATVDYTVGTVNQTDVNSNTATFKVDRKVLLTVAALGTAYTDVTPGDVGQVLAFTVTNDTNGPVDFRLDATQDAFGAADPYGNTDDFDVSVQVFVDATSGGTLGVYDAGDTETFLDEVPEGETRTVFIVASIPAGQPNDDTAGLTLTAYAAEPGGAGLGADLAESAGDDLDPLIVDTVLADADGDTDGLRDGDHSDDDAYRIRTATLTVTKTSTVISDPFNFGNNPKRIPGAVVEYCITVENNGSADALSVVLTDILTTQPVTYVNGSIFTEDGTTCSGGVNEDDDAVGVDEAPNGGSQASGTVSATFSTVPAGAGKAMRFRVTID